MERPADELARLRARVYGLPGAEPVRPGELDRLAELENARSVRSAESIDVSRPVQLVPAPEPTILPPATTGHSRLRTVAVISVAAVLTAAIGFTAGVLVFRAPSADTWPELAQSQTEDDVLIAAAASGLDPSSTRYIGRFDGFEIYLAKPIASDGICLVTAPGSAIAGVDGRSVTCQSGGPSSGGLLTCAMFTLAVAVGRVPDGVASGQQFQLSESVTVWRSCPTPT